MWLTSHRGEKTNPRQIGREPSFGARWKHANHSRVPVIGLPGRCDVPAFPRSVRLGKTESIHADLRCERFRTAFRVLTPRPFLIEFALSFGPFLGLWYSADR